MWPRPGSQLPFGLVAKQSPETRRDILRHYKRLRKRWVDKHKDSSADAKYIYDHAHLPMGELDTLVFSAQPPCGLALPRPRLLADGR